MSKEFNTSVITTLQKTLENIDKRITDDLPLESVFKIDSELSELYTVYKQVKEDDILKQYETVEEMKTKLEEKQGQLKTLLTTIQSKLDNDEFKGVKGDPLTFADLTPSQKADLKGVKGDPLTFADLTPSQKAELKGVKGDPLTFADLTPSQKAELKGVKGDPLTFADLTPSQKAELKGDSLFDTGWQDLRPYLVGDWVAFSYNEYPLQYRKIGDMIFLKGLVKGGNASLIFSNLPSLITPAENIFLHPTATADTLKDKTYTIITRNSDFKVQSYSPTFTSVSCCYLL